MLFQLDFVLRIQVLKMIAIAIPTSLDFYFPPHLQRYVHEKLKKEHAKIGSVIPIEEDGRLLLFYVLKEHAKEKLDLSIYRTCLVTVKLFTTMKNVEKVYVHFPSDYSSTLMEKVSKKILGNLMLDQCPTFRVEQSS